MDHTDGKATDPERRASVRTSRRISTQQDVGFDDDDDYALLALGISDGFRPQSLDMGDRSDAPQPAIRPDSQAIPPAHSPETQPQPQPQPIADLTSTPARLNRSSISKPPRGRDSLTLRHDGAMGHISNQSQSQSRVSSASTQSPYILNEAPYEGPSAPSHPYQMYSQNPSRLDRTLSVTTTSSTPTTRPESEYNGPRGPAHPYSMYPQNPFTDTSNQVTAPTVPAIPVGFANNTDPYQRRLGPDGEEIAGIIGPDGHTEELPPYTRYPDEYYNRKIRDNQGTQQEEASVAADAVPAATVLAATASSAVDAASAGTAAAEPPVLADQAIPGAGGIGLAARNPEFDAASESGTPQSRSSVRTSTNESHHEVNTAAAHLSEKQQLNGFQKLAKRKACGVIPYWAICLTTSAVIIVIIIVAVVIGTLLGGHKNPHNDDKPSPSAYQDSISTVTLTYDAVPVATPTDLPALPTGVYSLPLNLEKSPNLCFNDTAQTSAWSCNISLEEALQLQMSIIRNTPHLDDQGNYDVLIITNSSLGPSDNPLSYGTRPPVLEPAMGMELVNDTYDLERGPAWFRMLPYNKTVLVPEDLLSEDTSSKVRRNGGGFMPSPADLQRKGTAQSGDKPWMCYWPNTIVEVFVYAEQNSSYAYQTAASTGSITSATSTKTATATDSGATSTPTQVSNFMPLASYPRAVKVKERRIQEDDPPYCIQVTVNSDNTTSPVIGSDGQIVTIYIEEEEPGTSGTKSRARSSDSSNRKARRYMPDTESFDNWLSPRSGEEGDMSACGCMWFSS